MYIYIYIWPFNSIHSEPWFLQNTNSGGLVLSKDLSSSPGHRQKASPDPRDDFPESTLQGRDEVG